MAKIKMILTNPMLADPRVYKEAQYYISKGNDVEILCWDRECEAPEDDVLDGIKLKRFHIPSVCGSGLKKQLGAYLKFKKACIKYLKNKEFDVLHCHDLDGAIVGLSVSNKAKKVFDMHEYYLISDSKLVNRVYSYFINKAQNKFDHIIYLNDTQKNDVKEKNRNKLIYMPNYPEKCLFTDLTKTESNTVRIGYAGNIRTVTSFENLFKTVEGKENIHIDLYGRGETLKYLVKYQNDQIQIHGPYNYSETNQIYRNIDVVSCVYDDLKNDGFPIKFFESVASKTPLIVDKNSLCYDFVNKYDVGFIVDVNDITTYETMMCEINNNPQIVFDKRKNYDKVTEQFYWEEVVKELGYIV